MNTIANVFGALVCALMVGAGIAGGVVALVTNWKGV